MKEKIEGMIRDLLSKLPVIGPRFAQKNDDEDYEDGTTEVDISDDGEEDSSEVQEELEEDADLEEEDEEDEDEALLAKKKKRTLYIRIFIGLLVAYLLVDMFILDSGDEQQGDNSAQVSQESAQAKKIEEMRKKRQEEKRLAKEAAEKQQGEAAPTPTPAPTPAPTEAPQPVAQVDNTSAPAPVAQESQATKEIPEPTVATEESTTPENTVDNMASEVETSTDATTTESPDQLVDQVANQVDEQPADETSEGTEEQLSSDAGQVSATEAPGEVKEESAPVVEPAPSVVEKAEKYVAAPDYEERGRGLVYNCVGKHWACVNRKAYFQCRKNERWQKQEGKALECHLDKTYASNEDCEKVQKYKVNMNTSTDFCQAGN